MTRPYSDCSDSCQFVSELIEALHKVAYRDTLGHSLYMRQERVGKFSPQSVSGEDFLETGHSCDKVIVYYS